MWQKSLENVLQCPGRMYVGRLQFYLFGQFLKPQINIYRNVRILNCGTQTKYYHSEKHNVNKTSFISIDGNKQQA